MFSQRLGSHVVRAGSCTQRPPHLSLLTASMRRARLPSMFAFRSLGFLFSVWFFLYVCAFSLHVLVLAGLSVCSFSASPLLHPYCTRQVELMLLACVSVRIFLFSLLHGLPCSNYTRTSLGAYLCKSSLPLSLLVLWNEQI